MNCVCGGSMPNPGPGSSYNCRKCGLVWHGTWYGANSQPFEQWLTRIDRALDLAEKAIDVYAVATGYKWYKRQEELREASRKKEGQSDG